MAHTMREVAQSKTILNLGPGENHHLLILECGHELKVQIIAGIPDRIRCVACEKMDRKPRATNP